MKYPKNCIMTFSQVLMDPFDIRPEQIRIEDIAHSLSLMTRANGHLFQFFSVAQHSINCALEAASRGLGRRVQLACLMHDAAEAYIADIPRPVKHRLNGFAEIEEKISDAVFAKYGLSDLSDEETAAVAAIDDAMLHAEFDALMGIQIFDIAPTVSMSHDFRLRDMRDVDNQFIRLFNSLIADPENKAI